MGGGPRPAGWDSALLLLNGGHGFHGGVVQVLRCGDGQAALRQDPLGLVYVGSWQTRRKRLWGGGRPGEVKPEGAQMQPTARDGGGEGRGGGGKQINITYTSTSIF